MGGMSINRMGNTGVKPPITITGFGPAPCENVGPWESKKGITITGFHPVDTHDAEDYSTYFGKCEGQASVYLLGFINLAHPLTNHLKNICNLTPVGRMKEAINDFRAGQER